MSSISETPDYNMQVESDKNLNNTSSSSSSMRLHRAEGSVDSTKQSNDINSNSDEVDHFDENEDIGRGRRGRSNSKREPIPREPSGATSARSSSTSRSLSRTRADAGILPSADTPRLSSNDTRNASLSPTRAMGARSVSIERNGSNDGRLRTRLDTLEGIGASVNPVVSSDAFEPRGRTAAAIARNLQENAAGLPSGIRSGV